MTCDPLPTDLRERYESLKDRAIVGGFLDEMQAVIAGFHHRGKALGEAAVLKGLKTVAGLNGSGNRVMDLIQKAATFVESEHPRDHAGQFIPKGEVDVAASELRKGNSGPADALRAKVRPGDAAVLEEHLAHPTRADPNEKTGAVRTQREIGEGYGGHVADWLKAVTAAIRHGADVDHHEVQLATERAAAGQVPKLRRVLRALDPDTLVSHQPPTKEGLKKRIREIISTAVHAAKDDRIHRERAEKEAREREMDEHAARHAMTVHDARERLHRFESWHRAAPGDTQAADAVAAAREYVARLLGHESKAFKEDEHPRGQPENAGEFAPKGEDGGGKPDGESSLENKSALSDKAEAYRKVAWHNGGGGRKAAADLPPAKLAQLVRSYAGQVQAAERSGHFDVALELAHAAPHLLPGVRLLSHAGAVEPYDGGRHEGALAGHTGDVRVTRPGIEFVQPKRQGVMGGGGHAVVIRARAEPVPVAP